jgi:hypothetical protein
MTSSLVSAPVRSSAPVHDLAHRRELGSALATLHAVPGPGTVVSGPRGHALAPEHTLHEATRVWCDGRRVERASLSETECTPAALAGSGVVALRFTGPAADGQPEPSALTDQHTWTTGLLWLRLGLSRALLDSALSYLGGRTTGGVPLLRQQLVRGAVADGLIEHLEVESALLATPPGHELHAAAEASLHDQLTNADRGLVRLLGASGFTCEAAGRTAYVSELLADVYAGVAAEDSATERGEDNA